MHDEISGQVELTIEPARLDSFRAPTNEMIESARLEHGVLFYQRFLSQDGGKIFLYERYANSDAAISHLRSFKTNLPMHSGRW